MTYPVELEIDYPRKLSRCLNNPFLIWIKLLLAIPHLLILNLFQDLAYLLVFIASFAILFTGRFPEGLFNLILGYYRWTERTSTYVMAMGDTYPPFSMDELRDNPTRFTIDPPANLSRWLNNPFLFWIKWLFAIPHLFVLALYAIATFVVGLIALFAILFTGRYPRGMLKFNLGFRRWCNRVTVYLMLMTDQYPPFSGKPSAEIG